MGILVRAASVMPMVSLTEAPEEKVQVARAVANAGSVGVQMSVFDSSLESSSPPQLASGRNARKSARHSSLFSITGRVIAHRVENPVNGVLPFRETRNGRSSGRLSRTSD